MILYTLTCRHRMYLVAAMITAFLNIASIVPVPAQAIITLEGTLKRDPIGRATTLHGNIVTPVSVTQDTIARLSNGLTEEDIHQSIDADQASCQKIKKVRIECSLVYYQDTKSSLSFSTAVRGVWVVSTSIEYRPPLYYIAELSIIKGGWQIDK